MNIEKISKEYYEEFINYCIKYRKENDDSFITDNELKKFEIGDENPTFLLIENGTICGVLSLVANEYYLSSNKTRVRIFHLTEPNIENYKMLLNEAIKYNADFNNIEIFVNDTCFNKKEILEAIDFKYLRTSYVMIRKNKEEVKVEFPDGYKLIPFKEGRDEEIFMNIRNEAFKNIMGSYNITKKIVTEIYEDSLLLKNGMQILYDGEKPIGIIRVIIEEDETGSYSFIAPLAIIPEYQGKGLGKELLKAGIEIGQKNALNNAMLVVNAENEKALSLYTKNGYEILEAVSCYNYKF
ncbi:GNAT family N-acetyltransferase [Clostridiaceae bacterium HSG29]|nr:GNAT family N-acetyltransferase [Clostridiaceae bacterium HSG29]